MPQVVLLPGGDLVLLMGCASLVVICLLFINLSDMAKRPLAAHPFDACLSAELEPDAILTEVLPQSTRLREAFVEYKQLAVLSIGCGFAVPISDHVRNCDSTVFRPKEA